ncbi:endolytic transglycosylase MltG [Pyrinomonas methylaliphatogenes]|uniref:Endolytic murein transglycosylase n=1 Tax=Pyrinomonas methylaliphatogenes TaxID=454194 RepID=A0A0B6WUR0_9BACT|nr:endolytic transglycosylase MltG [Pyrinomonas methylaliphatogenes]CDM64771.1 conserved hypothetical protein, YceG family [Pyrinomonas methylaliphatogenes]
MPRLKRLLPALLLIGALICSATLWFVRELNAPIAHAHAEEYVVIPRGSTSRQIATQLAALGILRRWWPAYLYMRVIRARPKAGEYRFPSPITPLEVVRKLEEGEQRLNRFTVIEGWTRWDIADAMARLPELKIDPQEALALMDDTSLIKDLDPEAQNLEGYLYPDTYSFPPNIKPRDIIATMVRRFRQVWFERFAERARARGQSVHEVVTIASLIETEAKLDGERPLVASVIYNRLQRNMPLGIDSTVIYAAKLAGKWRGDGKVRQSDIERPSPYNTRQALGLPPGPVASPGARSIEAALNPATTNYLYYVREPTRDDGAHNFYDNEADFLRGVQALREWERQRRAQP